MSLRDISGNFLNLWITQRNSSRMQLILNISIGVILVNTVVYVSANDEKLSFRCDEENKWSASFDGTPCTDDLGIMVTRVYVYDKDCENPTKANNAIYTLTQKACNRKKICTTSHLDNVTCEINKCILVSYTCNKTTSDENDSDKDGVTTGNKGTSENSKNTSGNYVEDKKIVIIIVVSIVAFISIVMAVTLCLLYFFCQKSPLYRRGTTAQQRQQQSQQQQQQQQQQLEGEYDYVDESKFEVLNPSPVSDMDHHGTISVSFPKSPTSHTYQRTITSDFDDYAEVSSNESPEPAKRTIPSSQTSPTLTIISTQSELLKSRTSRSPQREEKHRTLPNLPDHHTRQPASETPVEYSIIQPHSESHKAASSPTDQSSSANAEDSVSQHNEAPDTCDLQQGIYSVASPTSSPSTATPAIYHSVMSVTGDYAHLTRPGEERKIVDNVYDG